MMFIVVNWYVLYIFAVFNVWISLFLHVTDFLDNLHCLLQSMPAYFCELLMPSGKSEVTLVDTFGHKWICTLNNDQENQSLCGLEDGWSTFCYVKLLAEGNFARFQVSVDDYAIILFEREPMFE